MPAPRKSTVTRLNTNRAPRGIGAAEWDARCELAAAYRLAAMLGWSDFLGTHFSLRVPGTEDQFLLNPYGMLFEEITASSLIKVDTEANKLSSRVFGVGGKELRRFSRMGSANITACRMLETGPARAESAIPVRGALTLVMR